jgi:nucleotide-binding universal stress UspA family protein
MPGPFRSILHPTDFSDASMDAFIHALKIALACQSELHILHVRSPHDKDLGNEAPHIRRTLAQWKLMDENDPPSDVGKKFGVKAVKIELPPQNPITAILDYEDRHPSDLMVLATHGREGLPRFVQGSIAETVARRAATNALFVAPGALGFVHPGRGEWRLKRILVPVDAKPDPRDALPVIRAMAGLPEPAAEIRFVHIGPLPPQWQGMQGRPGKDELVLRNGDPITGILDEAEEWRADLIAMPTAGHDGLMDAVRGSTTERVLRQAPCPVLAIPARPAA